MIRLALGIGLLLGSALPALAQQAPRPDCRTPTSTPEISYCLSVELKRADADLNVAYRQALGSIADSTELDAKLRAKWAETLKQAQRAWVAFRDADCGELIDYEMQGGTGLGAAMISCQLVKTKARVTELKQRYGGQ